MLTEQRHEQVMREVADLREELGGFVSHVTGRVPMPGIEAAAKKLERELWGLLVRLAREAGWPEPERGEWAEAEHRRGKRLDPERVRSWLADAAARWGGLEDELRTGWRRRWRSVRDAAAELARAWAEVDPDPRSRRRTGYEGF
jgi:hypothetical protein